MKPPPRHPAPSEADGPLPREAAPTDLLSRLAHACESLAVQDAALPPPLVRTLADTASALRAEAGRRKPR